MNVLIPSQGGNSKAYSTASYLRESSFRYPTLMAALSSAPLDMSYKMVALPLLHSLSLDRDQNFTEFYVKVEFLKVIRFFYILDPEENIF